MSLLNFVPVLTLPILCEAVNSWNVLHICSVISFTGLTVDFMVEYYYTVGYLEVNENDGA